MKRFLRHRRAVRRALERTKDRIAKLTRAERFRVGRTHFWLAEYKRRRKRFGEDDDRTAWALHKFRVSRALGWKIDHDQAVLHRRADRKLRWLRKHPQPLDPDENDLILVDGVPCSEDIGREILRIRRFGRWKGRLLSGWRSIAHSIELCFGICGASSCPGRCAGAGTRHVEKSGDGSNRGAGDLTDYITFREECARHGSFLENHLPLDLPHFSDAGN